MSQQLCQPPPPLLNFEYGSNNINNSTDIEPNINGNYNQLQQQQILEQLLLALTNQLAMQAISTHHKLDVDQDANNNELHRSYQSDTTLHRTSPRRLRPDFQQPNSLGSFDLDPHLDLERYMFLDPPKPNAQLTVDCTLPSTTYSQLSSSSNSSTSSSTNNTETKPKPNNLHPPPVQNRPMVYLSQLSGHLSSSSDCLSGDEGYFGSYTDSKNLSQEKPPCNNVQQQDQQGILLKHLLQNQHITQQQESIPCLDIFNDANNKQETFTSLLEDTNFCESCGTCGQFDVINLLSKSEKNFAAGECSVLEEMRLKEEILEIMSEQQLRRYEQEKADEIEMRSLNWRRLLEQRASVEKRRLELLEEDHVDGNAYLNEIEMNLDHFQSGGDMSEDDMIDTLLTFRSNKMAFNLRQHHKNILMEVERRKAADQDRQSRIRESMFAHVHVDSIAEFTPFIGKEYDAYDELVPEEEPLEYEYLPEDCDAQVYAQLEPYDALEHDYTMVDEGGETYLTEGYELEPELVEAVDCEGLYEEDYEDYEDQILVDSLSEQDALTLLRNESEMYALQMSQASKSGLLPKNKSTRKKKGRFDSGTSATDTQSEVSDIFENVFNFDEVLRATGDSGSELASSTASVSGATESSEVTPEFDLDINEFFMPQPTEGNGYISMSLRNSLLKLRHTRRHLAKLIDANNKPSASSGGSSVTGSLTNLHTPLSVKQITISALSRKPCVYMLNEGRCMRADCRFAHDLKQITCKYWIDGECLKGDACEFLHEMTEQTPPTASKCKSKTTKPPQKKKDFKLDNEEFPSLGGPPTAQSVPTADDFPTLGSPASTINKDVSLSSDFPSLAPAKTPPAPKTAAAVLKAAATSAVNIVLNKAQPVIAKSQPKQSQKLATSMSQKQRKQQQLQHQASPGHKSVKTQHMGKIGSCGSSSVSSSCSSSTSGHDSRGNSIVRTNNSKKI